MGILRNSFMLIQHTSAPVSKSQGEICPCALTLIKGLFELPLILAMLIVKIEKSAPTQLLLTTRELTLLCFSIWRLLLWGAA